MEPEIMTLAAGNGARAFSLGLGAGLAAGFMIMFAVLWLILGRRPRRKGRR